MERWASPCRAALLSNVLRSPSTIRPGGPCHGSPGPGSLRPGERVLQVTEKNLNTSLCSVCDRSPPTRDPPAFLQEKHAVVITGLPGKLQSLLVLKRPFARSRAKRQVRWLLTTPHHARCSSHPPVTRKPQPTRHRGLSSPQSLAVSRESRPPECWWSQKGLLRPDTRQWSSNRTQWKLNIFMFWKSENSRP